MFVIATKDEKDVSRHATDHHDGDVWLSDFVGINYKKNKSAYLRMLFIHISTRLRVIHVYRVSKKQYTLCCHLYYSVHYVYIHLNIPYAGHETLKGCQRSIYFLSLSLSF